LATIIHRRLMPSRRDPTPRGPGAGIGDRVASLTFPGFLSAIAAIAWLPIQLTPLLDGGAFAEARRWNDVALVLNAIGEAATIGLLAALELGVPDARRLAPSLRRGLILLALAQLSRPAIVVLQDLVVPVQPASQLFDYTEPLPLAFAVLTLATSLFWVGGAWSLSDGLSDTGARPDRRVIGAVVVAGVAAALATILPYLDQLFGDSAVLNVLNLVSLGISLVLTALWLVVATRLVSGLALHLRPHRAWLLGAGSGACLLLVRFGSALYQVVVSRAGQDWPGASVVGQALFVADALSWALLFLAFAAGMGRGRERREERPRRLRLFVLNPTS
jgi:hypothetical protein